MSEYLGIYPSSLERKKSHAAYKDDSDDEKITGPPKLSDFGAALLMEKENMAPSMVRRGEPSPNSFKRELKTRFGPTNTDYFSGSNNQTSFSQTYVSANSGEPSQSTIFAQSRFNQQPSMTTMDTNGIKIPASDLETSFGRIKSMQQSMREELTTRHAQRRSRRFLHGTRIGVLGPAKRASSTNGADMSDLSIGNVQMVQQTDNTPLEEHREVQSPAEIKPDLTKKETRTRDVLDYKSIDFGDMNPVQYLKLHNLSSSELPKLSKVYFERQREEIHQMALQKSISSREALTNKVQRSFSSISSSGNSIRRESSMPLYPRRKLSDTSVSSAAKTSFQSSFSSPLAYPKKNFLIDQPVVTSKPAADHGKNLTKQYAQREQYTLESSFKKREALANIDINRNSQESLQQPKRFKPIRTQEQLSESHLPEPYVNKEEYLNREPPKPRATKRVEILEPKPSQGQSRKNVVKVNDVEYEKVELLGRGGSSKVYKVRDRSNNVYALKRVVFDEFDDSSVSGFKGEIELLKKLENQNRVVQLVDHEMEHGVLYLIMECGDHDLSRILNHRAGMPLDMEFVRYHAREMLRCVKVVHDSGIVHSDLKPANFVFVKGILKIIDFGIANAVPDHTVNIYRENQIGTPNYMAPEALVAMNYTQDDEKYQQQNRWKVGKPSDIWSCGCIIYQMIYGRPPYGGFQGQNRLLAIMNPDVKIIFSDKTSRDETIPRSALDTMKACLTRNPDKRLTVDEVLESNFLKPLMVTPFFIRDLIKNAVRYGADQKEVSKEKVEELADDVLSRLSDFRL